MGPVLADPEKWVHLVGPDLHLVGTFNIFTIFSQGKVLYDKFHIYMCTYVKGNNNPPGSYWEIFSLGCTISQLVNFIKKLKNTTADIFVTNSQN